MTPEEQKLVQQTALFRDIDMERVAPLLESCEVVTVLGGEKLLEIGQQNNSLFLILDGELHIYLDVHDLTEHAVMTSGACVGELSLIDGGGTSALVIAAKDTRVVALPHHHVWALVDSSNDIARNLLCILAGRIRNDNLLRLTTHERNLEFEVASNVDALTGLHNQRWMDEAFPRMMQRCKRNGEPLCLLMADIDNFKDFNRAYGSQAGDSVLKAVARMLAEKLRPHDLLVYMGADKFVVLLPETSSAEALKIANRLCQVMAGYPLFAEAKKSARASKSAPLGPDTRVTLSAGVTEMKSGEGLESIFSLAHVALYQAKAAGGNTARFV